jgi:hypothetical protein
MRFHSLIARLERFVHRHAAAHQVSAKPFWNRGGSHLAIFLLLLGSGAGLVRADFPGDVPDRFKVQLGGVRAQFTTQGSLSVTNGPGGAFVDFEDIFDLPIAKSSWSAVGFWRFSDKGYLDFGYVDYSRTGGHEISQDIVWGDHTLLANAIVEAKFETAFYYLAWRHDFLRLDQAHIGFSAGLSTLGLTSGLAANGNVVDENGNPVAGEFSQEANVTFPVPLVGLQVDWKLTHHTAIQMYVRTLYVQTHGFEGQIRQSALTYEWYATRHFAIGGGFESYTVNLRKFTTGNLTARFVYDVQGLDYYLKVAF